MDPKFPPKYLNMIQGLKFPSERNTLINSNIIKHSKPQ